MSECVCPECSSASITDYKFGGYWCTTCLSWFTSREFENHAEEARTLIKVKEKSRVEA